MFSLKIRELRKKRKITQKQLAQKSNIAQSYISYLEKNNRNRSPSLRVIESLATALDVCPLELLWCNCKRCRCKKCKEKGR